MRVFILLLYFSPFAWGQQHDIIPGDHSPSDLYAQRRPPRQVKAFLSKEKKPLIHELSVKTTIISRYAFTAVTCSMHNIYSAAIEGVFQFQIPASAFVSNFTMIMAGQVHSSQIKLKEKKVKQLKEGSDQSQKEEGDSEGEVETFRAKARIPGKNRVLFLLTYEELLVRRWGRYEHVTSLCPMQLVGKLSVEVTIVEYSKITHLEVLLLRNGTPLANSSAADTPGKASLPVSTLIQQNKTFCKISFSPSIAQQSKIANGGLLGDFVVQYDVERDLGIGDVQVSDGHFVHYFAPKDLPVVPKNIVFVIDTSGSMVGTKIRQTKEALFTILRDLRPNDHFNFVSFSNRIKVWKADQLVPVTPDSIRDAKKFIYMLSPTGGTDINRAIETGSTLLSNYLSSKGGQHNGVSLLVFLTDGRPTVGEVQPSSILRNARSAVHGQFCVFTIGLGNDVDYRLLERLALDNCGTMRRIPEQADASTMLKGFYDEIGTPLLSDIRVAYSQDAVEYVTQHLFTNYFNGSEIVIAGKLTNGSQESLHVQVTASGSNASVVLETDVALQEREQEMERRLVEAGLEPRAEGYTERLWGFLSIKDNLKTRTRSQSSQERDEATQQATNLSLAYNFLTPVTSIVMKTPGDQMLGPDLDGTTDPSADENALHGELEVSGKPEHKPVSENKPIRISKTSADGDPHFMVEFPLSKLTMCFNINGEPGQVLRLVSDDRYSGVTVNGKLVGAPAPTRGHKKQRTYFSTIAVVVSRPMPAYLEVTPQKVVLDARDHLVLPTDSTTALEIDELAVAIAAQSNVTVTIRRTIVFVILIHQYKNPAPFQRDHLGFYISNSKGLSENSHGLLGQFLFEEVSLTHLATNTTLPINMTESEIHSNTTLPEVPAKGTKPEVTKIFKADLPTTATTSAAIGDIRPPVAPKNTSLTNLTLPDVTNEMDDHLKTKRSTDLTNTTRVKLVTKTPQAKTVINSDLSTSLQLKVQTNEHRLMTKTSQLQPPKSKHPEPPTKTSQPQQPPKTKHPEAPTKTSQPQQPPKTKHPEPPTKTSQPQPPKTKHPEPPTKTSQPQQPPKSKHPEPPTKTLQPQPPKTKHPEPPTKTSQPQQPPKSKHPEPPTKTSQPQQPPKSKHPESPTKTSQPQQPPKTKHPEPPKTSQLEQLPKTKHPEQPPNSSHAEPLTKTSHLKQQPKTKESETNNTQQKVLTNTAQDNGALNPQHNIPINTTQGSETDITQHKSDSIRNGPQQKVLTSTAQDSGIKNTQQKVTPNATQKTGTDNMSQHKVINTARDSESRNTQHKVVPNATQVGHKNSKQYKAPSQTAQRKESTNTTKHQGSTDTTQCCTTQHTNINIKSTQHEVQMNTTGVKDNDSTHTVQQKTVSKQQEGFIHTTHQTVLAKSTHDSGSVNITEKVLQAKVSSMQNEVSTNCTNNSGKKVETQQKVPVNTKQYNSSITTMQKSGVGNTMRNREHRNISQHEVLQKAVETKVLTENAAATNSSTLTNWAFAALRVKGRTITVMKKTRTIYSGEHTVDCWFVKNSAVKLIEGRYEDYVVSYLYDTSNGPHGLN